MEKKYPEKVRVQKRRHYEYKVWPPSPRTRQRKKTETNMILMKFFGVCFELEPGIGNKKKTNTILMKFCGVCFQFVSS